LGRALLLNASFEPLCVLPARRAVVLVLREKAEIVSRNGAELHSERLSVPVPSVLRLVQYVRVPHRNRVPLSKRAVFARDGHRCQYCDRAAENVDHIVPRSRGGLHEWENVVASCRACNARKEDQFLHETTLRLRRLPTTPHHSVLFAAASGSIDPAWEQWLGSADPIPA
jgi:5-methylcytosine-specific restriction endonuclease McrA